MKTTLLQKFVNLHKFRCSGSVSILIKDFSACVCPIVFIFGLKLKCGELYHVSPKQVHYSTRSDIILRRSDVRHVRKQFSDGSPTVVG